MIEEIVQLEYHGLEEIGISPYKGNPEDDIYPIGGHVIAVSILTGDFTPIVSKGSPNMTFAISVETTEGFLLITNGNVSGTAITSKFRFIRKGKQGRK